MNQTNPTRVQQLKNVRSHVFLRFSYFKIQKRRFYRPILKKKRKKVCTVLETMLPISLTLSQQFLTVQINN